MRKTHEQLALALCDEVRECDDYLGRVSDHEGQKDGPTWARWMAGKDAFRKHSLAVISWHEHAIRVYRRFLKLNEKRA